ncbi:MAG: GNAT family N-acetyltransferase, partial [Clostridia bacterium]|nr:GNAT family N-acetyltransferase [Clostridia bacterium]
ESRYLKQVEESKNKVEILAFLNGALVGIAGITPVGRYFKVAHRAVFGISVLKDHWGAGIGSELTKACIECAMMAGYKQIELEVLADNVRAVSLYEKFRFRIIGSNPLGFRFRTGEYCETVYMRLEI